jgi:ribosome-associated translation inhibitor RaiA
MTTRTRGIDHTRNVQITVARETRGPTSTDSGYSFRQAAACLRLGKGRRVCGNGKGGDASEAIAAALEDLSYSLRRHDSEKSERRP